MNPRVPWLLGYLLVNLIAWPLIIWGGELLGDAQGHPAPAARSVAIATLLVCLSYVLILGPVFSGLYRIKVTPSFKRGISGKLARRVGIIILTLQLGFLYFNISTGVNVAGSASNRTTGALSMFWIAFPADALFLIYYTVARSERMFYPNLVVWIISNMQRGWTGIFFIIAFLEFCRAWYKGQLSTRKVLFWLVIGLTAYPILMNIKWAFRAAAGLDKSVVQVVKDVDLSALELSATEYIGGGILHVVSRLHTTSMLLRVADTAPVLASQIEQGSVAPFWKEGLVGLAFDRLMGNEKIPNIGVAITDFANLGDEERVGEWNVNISYIGWLFISPFYIPLYISYTLLLCLGSVVLVKRLNAGKDGMNGLWLAWLLYLLPPWWGAFVGHLYALLVFLAIAKIAQWTTRPLGSQHRRIQPPRMNPKLSTSANSVTLRDD